MSHNLSVTITFIFFVSAIIGLAIWAAIYFDSALFLLLLVLVKTYTFRTDVELENWNKQNGVK